MVLPRQIRRWPEEAIDMWLEAVERHVSQGLPREEAEQVAIRSVRWQITLWGVHDD